MTAFTNRLAKESSPYLLQHAHNPVDWYPWGDEALQKAKAEDKPILVSIGYSACHWCHVMERESFEDTETAEMMNANFVCIKIDREERPDLDHIYMDAVQAMTGSGGWPLNVFLTPDKKPFFGGTYFPPRAAFNRPSWRDVLTGISRSFREKKGEIEGQAETLTAHLLQSNSFGLQKVNQSGDDLGAIFNASSIDQVFSNIMSGADKEEGGFGRAPKFPQTFTIGFLLHYYHFSKNEDALKQACLSLDKMIAGGIYDQIGGGFARYSTDNEWLAPHFEKMLYDNALLVITLSEAWQLTKKDIYRNTIIQTMEFVNRELSSPDGGFYAALDADSEGEEGRYYVWDKSEVEEILQEDAGLFCEFYDITAHGNWEGKNILRIRTDAAEFSKRRSITESELSVLLEASRRKLLTYRAMRIRPLTDDKILLGWNALMIIACCKAYAALGIDDYRDRAIKNMEFIRHGLKGEGLHFFYHTYAQGVAKFPAFLEDYAFLTAALLQLQEITGDTGYLAAAKEITSFAIDHFGEEDSGFFFYTHQDQQDVIIRKKEVYDGAIPSGNAVMAFNLLYLSVIFDKPEWKERSIRMCSSLSNAIIKYPSSFGIWATLIQAVTFGVLELVITGENLGNLEKDFLTIFMPYRVYQSTTLKNTQFPLLLGKPVDEGPLIFLCKDYSCQTPVTEIAALIRLLENVQNYNVKTVQ